MPRLVGEPSAVRQGVSTEDLQELEHLEQLRLPPGSPDIQHALGSKMGSPRYSRLRVMQEAALAREITVLCGFSILSWHTLKGCSCSTTNPMQVIGFLPTYPVHHYQRKLCSSACGSALTVVLSVSSILGAENFPNHIESMISLSEARICSDPRDWC